MLNPFPLIWRSEPVALPDQPLADDALARLRTSIRPHPWFLGDYPACIGRLERDRIALRLGAVPTHTGPPWLVARFDPAGGWRAELRRSLGKRLVLSAGFGLMLATAAVMAGFAVREFPAGEWTYSAIAAAAILALVLALTAGLRWEVRSWAWQRERLLEFVADGFHPRGGS